MATPEANRPVGATTNRPFSNNRPSAIQTFVTWLWIIIGFIPRLLAYIFRELTTPGTAAAITVGGLIFLCGVLMSADNYWQMWSQQPALFHFFEKQWLGWGWFPTITLNLSRWWFPLNFKMALLTNGNLIFALVISCAVQMIQSAAVRNLAFKSKSIGGISARTIGLISIGSWVFDFIMAFASRSIFQFDDPGMRIGCFFYNLFSIFAAELGYIIFEMMKTPNSPTND
ncbi:hypothetical protein PI95_030400 [Hassallia byssoidea VB512170]|uniref:Uncharacterized protein n=1 Tax=Hassallia byssoidea VB512170 TaxID=1304833 RepID=A0A846HJ22_9CYAN|nr:hypothetical protein [Hassalia byssoidea]NEU76704.1 hypothetical protein [Hassalia byssoidea VB512170]